jgi:segregation and condensation protein B
MRFSTPTPSNRYGPAARRTMAERPGNAPRAAAARRPAANAPSGPADPLARDAALAALEAALFLADEPLTAKRLADVLGLPDAARARGLADRLRDALDAEGSAFAVAEVAGGYHLLSRPAYHPWLVRLKRTGHDPRLTPAAMETLAVVAYKQPVTRADVEAIRGVNCVELLALLAEKGLVRVAGRHASLGRPQLFATTKSFLRHFGLDSLADLPAAEGLRPPS